MDFILSWNNHEGELVFPIIPNGGIALAGESDNSTFSTINGELQLIGRKKLRQFEISSFFPMKSYPFMRPGSLADGMEYVSTIETVRARRIPFRAVYLDNSGRVLFNMPVSVTSFEWGIDAAGDIAYKLNFCEYRFADLSLSELGKQDEPESVPVESQKAAEAAEVPSTIAGTTDGTIKRVYTDAEALWAAKSMYCEWGGEFGDGAKGGYINSKGEKVSSGGTWVNVKTMFAAHVWCQCNYADACGGGKLSAVQKVGRYAYKSGVPTKTAYGTDLYALAKDVLDRWSAERAGQSNVGRILPKAYMYYGGDGVVNHFRDSYTRPWNKWGFGLPTPYAD